MPSKKRGSDNSTRSSRPSSSKSTTKPEEPSEENSRDTNTNDNAPSEYAVNTRVLCRHNDLLFYDAKIIQAKRNDDGELIYTIHYNGWNSRYDELLTHEEAIVKFLPYTPENVAMAQKEINDARRRKRPRTSARSRRERDSAVAPKKQKSTTPAITENSERNTPIGEIKASKTEPDSFASVLSESPLPVPSRLHPKKVEIMFPSVLFEVLVKDAEMINISSKLVKISAAVTIDKIIKDFKSSQRNPFSNIPNANFNNDILHALLKTFCQCLSTKLIFKFETNQFLNILNKKRNELGYSEITLAQYHSSIKEEDEKSNEAEVEELKDEVLVMRETRSKRQSKVESAKKELKSGSLKNEDIPYCNAYGFIHFLRFLHQFITGKDIQSPIPMFNFYAPIISDLLEFLVLKRNDYYKQDADYEAASKAYKANQ